MRNLVVCCDGTWNTPTMTEAGLPSPTNVVKLFNLCIEDAEQLRYYHPGVGTEGGLLRRVLGGGLGTGLDANIKSGYEWLCRNYQAGDRIFLFGFSRGAYTARSLGGFILRCGLPDLSGLLPEPGWERVETAYRAGYRERRPRSDWGADWPMHKDAAGADQGADQGPDKGADPDIHFIGVWDTVGARGVPDDMVWLDLILDNPARYSFHDTRLSPRVHHARHAVAMDEPRSSFAPTLWTTDDPRPPGTTLVQLWFPGCHKDVGGGYGHCGLADGALRWMADEAGAWGLRLDTGMLAQVCPDPRGPLHDSVTGLWKLMRTLPRAVPELTADAVHPPPPKIATLHESTWERHLTPPVAQAPYRWPSHRLAPGRSETYRVYARERWNVTGLWLEEGADYRFEANGQWLDSRCEAGPEGSPIFKTGCILAYSLGSLLGKFEQLYQWLTGKQGADWGGTRRVESAPWFSLVGMVANQADADGSGTPPLGQMLPIGAAFPRDGKPFSPEHSGYLYCFANDAWSFYGNNRGSVSLTVTRVG